MAEVTKPPKASVWKEWELDTQLITPGKIKLNLKPLFKKDKVRVTLFLSRLKKSKDAEITEDEILDFLQANMDFVLDFIIGWDLEIKPTQKSKSRPFPFSKENKKNWMELLLWENIIVSEEDKKERTIWERTFPFLGIEILKFCANMENFTKN